MSAQDTRSRTSWGARFRFLFRVIGLTGIVAYAVGAAMAYSHYDPATVEWKTIGDDTVETTQTVLDGGGETRTQVAVYLMLGGAGAVALALIVELLVGLFGMAFRRTAARTSATIGVVAAIALLVFVNAYSFQHHERFDFTRDQQFTVPAELAEKLRKLRPDSPTTVVVFQNHNLFGSLSDKRDAFTKAAEDKVTEKVKDLVDLFREFGPRFHVEVLDTEAFGYQQQLEQLTKDSPELREAIEAAPEDSIFVHANGRVQRLAFNQFLQLDRTASAAANDGKGNLVLLPQGMDNFARRVLHVHERRPKVAVCVVHEWLTTAEAGGVQSQYSLAGLRKALDTQGFEVVDIVLKRFSNAPGGGREPAAYSLAESRLERLEAERADAELERHIAEQDLKILLQRWGELVPAPLDKPGLFAGDLASSAGMLRWAELPNVLASARQAVNVPPGAIETRLSMYNGLQRDSILRGWGELVRTFAEWIGDSDDPTLPRSESEFRAVLFTGLSRQILRAGQELEDARKELAEAEKNLHAARDERTLENRRETNVKEKFAAQLADVDLLIIPRHTIENAPLGDAVPAELHTLSDEQVEVIKDFMKQGKPVLACMGSLSDVSGFDQSGVDQLDQLIAERGIVLGRDTILFDAEKTTFTGIRSGRLLGGSTAEIPPLVIEEQPLDTTEAKPNPVGAALLLTSRSVEQDLGFRLHAPRPVYIRSSTQDRIEFAAEFLLTDENSWNEAEPFARRSGRNIVVPRFKPTLDEDPEMNPLEVERRGPFPIGVAIESPIPAYWIKPEYEKQQAVAAMLMPVDGGVASACLTAAATQLDRPEQRLIVFGSGHLFSGTELEPGQEKLLVHSVNWLTGREDRLPQDEHLAWQFPRVELTQREFNLWRYGTAIGLPLLVVYLGLTATMFRRMR